MRHRHASSNSEKNSDVARQDRTFRARKCVTINGVIPRDWSSLGGLSETIGTGHKNNTQ